MMVSHELNSPSLTNAIYALTIALVRPHVCIESHVSRSLSRSMPFKQRQSVGGKPLVVADPSSVTAGAFMDLGAAVVREISKLKAAAKASLRCILLSFLRALSYHASLYVAHILLISWADKACTDLVRCSATLDDVAAYISIESILIKALRESKLV